MPNTLTLEEIERIEALYRKATPRPWIAFFKAKYKEWHVSVPLSHSTMKQGLFPDGIPTENPEADAQLIVALHDNCLALCDAAKQATTAGLDATTSIADAVRDIPGWSGIDVETREAIVAVWSGMLCDGWIPVTERLPAAREIVHFVADFHGSPAHCTGYKVSSDPDDARWHDFEMTASDGEYRNVYGVTHWRPRSPLPSAPTQEPLMDNAQ